MGSCLTDDWEGCTIATIGLRELTERPAKARSDRCILYLWRCCRSDLATRRRNSSFPSRTVFNRFAMGNNEIELSLERMRTWRRTPYAWDFYKTGPPFLQRHLPFWLAVFIKQGLILLIPLVAILLPVLRFAPEIYDWLEKRRVYRLYSELRRIEEEMFFAAPNGTQKDFIERLDRLKERASRLSVPIPFKPHVYALRLYIDMVRREAEKLNSPQN